MLMAHGFISCIELTSILYELPFQTHCSKSKGLCWGYRASEGKKGLLYAAVMACERGINIHFKGQYKMLQFISASGVNKLLMNEVSNGRLHPNARARET